MVTTTGHPDSRVFNRKEHLLQLAHKRRIGRDHCEVCGKPIRVSLQYKHTKPYKEWLSHIASTSGGVGAPICWSCYRHPR